MKFAMMLMLTSTSYAPRTDVPAWPRNTNTAAMPACTSSATCGVCQRGCRSANARGRKRSMPATNGRRAVAANQPATAPSALSETSSGEHRHEPRHAGLAGHRLDRLHEALQPGHLLLRQREQDAQRARRCRSIVMNAAAVRIARGTVRLASTISSPIVDALSTPPNANAIVDQKMMSLRPVLGTSDAAVIGVADPYVIHE